jgi:hypothetical protein
MGEVDDAHGAPAERTVDPVAAYRGGVSHPAGVRQGKKVFFSEKKKQKTFAVMRLRQPVHVRQMAKVFWFFFSKKNIP